MDKVNVTFNLDPVNDGAEIINAIFRRKDEGALIIATNGDKRIADASEAQRILDRLTDVGYGEYIGNTPYLIMCNGNKILNFGTGKCLIGTVIIMKFDGKGLSLLSGKEFDEAAKEFESRLIRIVGDGQEFSAYELS